jgi:hypothetical protein
MEIDLEQKAAELAEVVDRPVQDVLAELQALVNQGHDYAGAVVRWKTDNKFQLGAGVMERIGRLIGIEPRRIVDTQSGQNAVASFHFIVKDLDTGEPMFNQAAVWNDERIDALESELVIGNVYRFKAAERNDGTLNRLRSFEVLADEMIVDVDEIEPLPIEKLPEAVGANEMIRGRIGRIIGDVDPIGFEISDMSTAPPVTVWFGGQYSKIPLYRIQEIVEFNLYDEICAYGYISQGSSDIRLNAVNVWKVNK